MKKQAKKLSLADFKAKAKSPNSQELLNKISGGVLDSCHTGGGGGPIIIDDFGQTDDAVN